MKNKNEIVNVCRNISHTTIEDYLNGKYRFRLNEVTGRIEYTLQDNSVYHEVSDYIINSIYRELTNRRFKTNIMALRFLLNSNFVPKFNPFKNYVCSLPQWDGSIDHIMLLGDTVTTSDKDFWQKCLKKWLVASIGSITDDSVVNHTVLVFSGAQGIGKTKWMLRLVPDTLKEFQYSGTINPENKDTLIQLSECFIINMDELENLNKSELGSLKSLITQDKIRIRKPYGYSSETMPRRASFVGSVNGKDFLSDTTGNRRFLCFETDKIDYMHNVDINLVYAQAYSLFKSGFQYWFDNREIIEISTKNEHYRRQTIEEQLLLKYFEPCEREDADYELMTCEILKRFHEEERLSITNAASQALGRALSANGFKRYKKFGRYVYGLKEINAYSNSNAQIVA